MTGEAGELVSLVAGGLEQAQVLGATYTAGAVSPIDSHALLFHPRARWVVECGQFPREFERFARSVIESVQMKLLRVTRLKRGVALTADPCRNMRRLSLGIEDGGH